MPSDESLRLRLEGGAELLEAAHGRYVRMERELRRPRWRRALRAHPGLVREVLEQDSEVQEVLRRVLTRSEVEGWPAETPVLVTARAVADARARLEARLGRRLASLGWREARLPLGVALSGLETAARQSTPYVLEPGETLVFQDDTPRRSSWSVLGAAMMMAAVSLLSLLLVLLLTWALAYLQGHPSVPEFSLGALLFMPLTLCGMLFLVMLAPLCDGRFWLTDKRLWWMIGWKRMAVDLRAITSVHEDPHEHNPHHGVGLRVQVGNRVENVWSSMEPLEVLNRHLTLCLIRTRERLPDLRICPARQRWRWGGLSGWAVVWPGGAAFIPRKREPVVLETLINCHAALDARVRSRISYMAPLPVLTLREEEALELLTRLPESSVDACVERLVEATDGQLCPASEARGEADEGVFHIRPASESVQWTPLELVPAPRQRAELERVLALWPRQ
ncbi:MAG TPA: hypothetical protein VE153_32755 [Myxococcus sp.]|nr:hypothetical protein [Myxococcus sp.]